MSVATLMCCMVKILKTLMGGITSLYLKIIEWRRKTKPPQDLKDIPGTKGAIPLLQAYFHTPFPVKRVPE